MPRKPKTRASVLKLEQLQTNSCISVDYKYYYQSFSGNEATARVTYALEGTRLSLSEPTNQKRASTCMQVVHVK